MNNLLVLQMNETQLKGLIMECLDYCNLNKPEPQKASIETDELLTTAEVCTLLKVTRGALHSYKTKGLIPAHRLGAKVRFKKSEVIAALHAIKTKGGK